jgi:hypothetical protein
LLIITGKSLHFQNNNHLPATDSKDLITTVWSQTEYIEGTPFIPASAKY